MTILEPKRTKAKFRLKLIAGVFLAFLIGISTFAVVSYTDTVRLRHDISKLEGDLSKLQAENVDLKNQVYSILSPDHLAKVGKGLGFRFEKDPRYLETPVDALTQL